MNETEVNPKKRDWTGPEALKFFSDLQGLERDERGLAYGLWSEPEGMSVFELCAISFSRRYAKTLGTIVKTSSKLKARLTEEKTEDGYSEGLLLHFPLRPGLEFLNALAEFCDIVDDEDDKDEEGAKQ